MSSLNVSLPQEMRMYIEQKAEEGSYTESEYIRHLIRQDMKSTEMERMNLLKEYLKISVSQLDNGDYGTLSIDEIIKHGRARRAKKKKGGA